MKKTYKIPALNTIAVNATQMIAESRLEVNQSKTTGTQYTKESGSWGDIWGSDEE